MRSISRKMSQPWNRELSWSLVIAFTVCSGQLIFLSSVGWEMTSGHGSYSQVKSGKVREKSENQKKSGNFTFQSQWKMRWSGKVRKNQSTRVQKLTKMWKKIFELFCVQQIKIFFCLLCSQITCIAAFKFVLSPLFLVRLQSLESQHWYFMWTN